MECEVRFAVDECIMQFELRKISENGIADIYTHSTGVIYNSQKIGVMHTYYLNWRIGQRRLPKG